MAVIAPMPEPVTMPQAFGLGRGFEPGEPGGEIGGVRMAVAGIDEAGLGALHDGVEGVEVGQGVDGRRVERRHQRAAGAEVGIGHGRTPKWGDR